MGTDRSTPGQTLVEAAVEPIDHLVAQRVASRRGSGQRAAAMKVIHEGEALIAAILSAAGGESREVAAQITPLNKADTPDTTARRRATATGGIDGGEMWT